MEITFDHGALFDDERLLPFDIAIRLTKAYEASCKQLCRDAGLTQTAFDVLIFLANNPSYNTACDVVAKRGFKPTQVSACIDRLVELGYVRREDIPLDRRKVKLVVTDAAREVVKNGRIIRQDLYKRLAENVSLDDAAAFERVMRQVSDNIDEIVAEGKKRGSSANAKGER